MKKCLEGEEKGDANVRFVVATATCIEHEHRAAMPWVLRLGLRVAGRGGVVVREK
jgi:hypothetical protein